MDEITLSEIPNRGWDARVRVFRAGDEVDTAVVMTERFVVVVDTMATPELAAEIGNRVREALAGRQLLVVNTHADWDHCWGNAAFAFGGPFPAPLIAHELARERLLGEEARRELAEKRREQPRFASVRLFAPDITFAAGLRIAGGDLTLELLPTPGHTPDHVSVWLPEARVLLAGDAAEHPFPYVGEAAALSTLRSSLRRLAALAPTTVIPCHGGPSDAGLIARNLAYFDDLERRARKALAASAIPDDWRQRDDVPALLGVPYESALHAQGATPDTVPAFYREFHARACRAALLDADAAASI